MAHKGRRTLRVVHAAGEAAHYVGGSTGYVTWRAALRQACTERRSPRKCVAIEPFRGEDPRALPTILEVYARAQVGYQTGVSMSSWLGLT